MVSKCNPNPNISYLKPNGIYKVRLGTYLFNYSLALVVFSTM